MSVLIFVPRPFTLQEHVFVKSRACGCSESAGWRRASCLYLNCGFSVQPSKRRMGTSQNRLFSEVSYSCSFYVPLPGSRSSQVAGGFLISYIRSLVKCHLQKCLFKLSHLKWFSPGWYGSMDWVPACKSEGCRFNSQSGRMAGLRARSPVGDA